MSQMTDIVMIVLLGGGAIFLFGTPQGQEILNKLTQTAQAVVGGGGGGGNGKGAKIIGKVDSPGQDLGGGRNTSDVVDTADAFNKLGIGTVPQYLDPISDLNLKPAVGGELDTLAKAKARVNPNDPNQSWLLNPGKAFGGVGYNGDDQDIGDDGEIITGANSYVYANSMADAAYDNITGFV